jgi:hypothetical protein
MKRSLLTSFLCTAWSPSDLAPHAEGRDDQPRAAVLIGGHLH